MISDIEITFIPKMVGPITLEPFFYQSIPMTCSTVGLRGEGIRWVSFLQFPHRQPGSRARHFI